LVSKPLERFLGLALKPVMIVSPSLTSKSVAIVSFSLALKPVAQVSGLGLKIITMFFLVWVSKPSSLRFVGYTTKSMR
jgi:hypothetical protein